MSFLKTVLGILGLLAGILIPGPIGKLIGVGLTMLAGGSTGRRSRSSLDESTRYGFDNLTNNARDGGAVPVIYGQEQVAPQLVSTNLIQSGETQVLHLLFLVCEGEIESITTVRLNDTPIETFQGASYDTRLGTSGQSVITDFNQRGVSYDAGTHLGSGTIHTHEMREEADELVLNFAWLGGLVYVGSDGSANWVDSKVKVEWKRYGAADTTYAIWNQTTPTGWRSMGNGSFQMDGKSFTVMRRQMRMKLTGTTGVGRGRYVFRVTGQGANEARKIREPDLTGIVEVSSDQRTYAGRALLAVRCPASGQLSGGIPRVTCLVKGKKVYNPATGLTAWSRNPVWCLRDLLLNSTYGLGQWISSTDIDDGVGGSWRTAAAACDATVTTPLGLSEARHELDLVMDVKAPARDWIDQICRGMRADVYAAEGLLKISRHVDGATVRAFSEDEGDGVRKGILTLQEGDGGERSTLIERGEDEGQRWTAMRIRHVDRDDGYRQHFVTVRDLLCSVADPFTTGTGFSLGQELKGPTTGSGTSRAVCTRAISSGGGSGGLQTLRISQADDAAAWVGGIGSVQAQSGVAASATLVTAPAALSPERIFETNMHGVTRRTQALREARYHLNLAQLCPRFVTFEVFWGDQDLEPGDIITITSARLGYSAKKWVVLSITVRPDGRAVVEGREHDPAVFTDTMDPVSATASFQPGGVVPPGVVRATPTPAAPVTTQPISSPSPAPAATTQPSAAPPASTATSVSTSWWSKK